MWPKEGLIIPKGIFHSSDIQVWMFACLDAWAQVIYELTSDVETESSSDNI